MRRLFVFITFFFVAAHAELGYASTGKKSRLRNDHEIGRAHV